MRTDVSKSVQQGLKKRYQIQFRRWVRGENRIGIIHKFIGMDRVAFRQHIESQWLEGMAWYNYGDTWVIDHIIPLRLFDMTDDNDMAIVWNWQNTMPLYKGDNLHKEGALEFSVKLLRTKVRTDITTKLIILAQNELDHLGKYLIV